MEIVGVSGVQPQAESSACSELPALAPDSGLEDRVGTRNRVARLILANGPSTAADLALRLGLTPAGVRRHLDALLAEGLVEAREQRVYGQRGRGRPAKVFALTGDGRSVFHHTYDDMAIDALRFIAESGGERAVDAFARRRFAGLAERYRELLSGAEPAERPQLLAEALTADGYAASTRTTASVPVPGKRPTEGAQVCQHHCPVQHVAEEFPQLCEAETQVFAELLGTHVQRLATIAHGDGVCTTFIPMVAGHQPAANQASPTQATPSEQSEGVSA
ncbi:MAG TPA: metalloregulator ArsR/SmtB family transcription factor [Actinocrinis sp.]|nr:metalloregulator ArsR/SmtB family transcription factor [Actinocrinis sp.]